MQVKHVLFAAAVTVSVAALAGPSLGAGSATAPVRVSGTQIEVDQAKGKYQMRGSLVGPWQITSFKPTYYSPSQFAANGTELFTGCLDSNRNGTCETGEPTGTLRFAATFWGELDPKTKRELRGGCFHAVTAGSGGFAGAKGVIAMVDTPAGNDLKTTYRGELELAAGASQASTRSTQSVRPAASSPGC